jgi:hypothetical protein
MGIVIAPFNRFDHSFFFPWTHDYRYDLREALRIAFSVRMAGKLPNIAFSGVRKAKKPL